MFVILPVILYQSLFVHLSNMFYHVLLILPFQKQQQMQTHKVTVLGLNAEIHVFLIPSFIISLWL